MEFFDLEVLLLPQMLKEKPDVVFRDEAKDDGHMSTMSTQLSYICSCPWWYGLQGTHVLDVPCLYLYPTLLLINLRLNC